MPKVDVNSTKATTEDTKAAVMATVQTQLHINILEDRSLVAQTAFAASVELAVCRRLPFE
jgi:hypothetical protein